MVTFVQTADNSDLTPSWANTSLFDKDMIEGATGNGQFSISVPASTTRSGSFITIAGVPNNDSWEDAGTYTVEIDLMMGDGDVTGDCRCVALNSTGTILQSGNFIGTQVMDVSRTFSPVAPTWTTSEACGNRLAIEFVFVESAGMNATLQFNIRVATAEVITDITTDSASCAAAAIDVPLLVNPSAMI